jgi:hypothetical protein
MGFPVFDLPGTSRIDWMPSEALAFDWWDCPAFPDLGIEQIELSFVSTPLVAFSAIHPPFKFPTWANFSELKMSELTQVSERFTDES